MLRAITRFALLPLLALGCDRQTADGDHEVDGGGECVETVTVLADIDAVSALGFAPAELLALAAGEHSSEMVWGTGIKDSIATVSFGPESGAGMLTATITHKGGEARYIASKLKDSGVWDGGGASCEDRVEIDVEVTLASAGGALMESFVAPLRGSTAKVATVHHEIELMDLGGKLELTQVEPEQVRVGAMQIELGISEGGLFGGASSTVEVPLGDSVAATFMTYATWPGGDSPCEPGEAVLPLEGSIADFSGADALALVGAAVPLQITWQGGEPVELSFALSHDGESVCGRYEGDYEGTGLGALRFGAELMVASGDGKWMGSFPVQVTAQPDAGGKLGSVSIGIYAAYANSVAAAEFAEIYGLSEPKLADYDRGILDFGGTFTPAGDSATADGTLKIVGVTEVPCPPDPSGGCMGDDYTDLASAAWGTL
jgi:hypothetical protein